MISFKEFLKENLHARIKPEWANLSRPVDVYVNPDRKEMKDMFDTGDKYTTKAIRFISHKDKMYAWDASRSLLHSDVFRHLKIPDEECIYGYVHPHKHLEIYSGNEESPDKHPYMKSDHFMKHFSRYTTNLTESKKLGAVLAVGLAVGGYGGSKLADHHARMDHIDKITKSAIENPFYDRRDSEFSKDEMGSFINSVNSKKKLQSNNMKVIDPSKSKAKGREIHPGAELATRKDFNTHKAGRFSINSGPPAKGLNKWYDGTTIDTTVKKR